MIKKTVIITGKGLMVVNDDVVEIGIAINLLTNENESVYRINPKSPISKTIKDKIYLLGYNKEEIDNSTLLCGFRRVDGVAKSSSLLISKIDDTDIINEYVLVFEDDML